MKRRAARAFVTAALAAAVLTGASACGFNAQTLQPYTQSHGVNVDSRTDPDTDLPLVKVRNLMVVSKEDGSGFLVGAMFSEPGDKLTDVSIVTKKVDGNAGQPVKVDLAEPIEIPAGGTAQLFGDQTVTATGADLRMGFSVEITMTFEEAGDVTVTAPVVDGNLPDFETMSPEPAAEGNGQQ
ncbi:hypothetical protein [Enemella sp. A6]|uniref:hypothetical protein n=1 Tax=Enemella sp. A6 TaxID=3440152 RepID=UPI003EBC28F2